MRLYKIVLGMHLMKDDDGSVIWHTSNLLRWKWHMGTLTCKVTSDIFTRDDRALTVPKMSLEEAVGYSVGYTHGQRPGGVEPTAIKEDERS